MLNPSNTPCPGCALATKVVKTTTIVKIILRFFMIVKISVEIEGFIHLTPSKGKYSIHSVK